MEIVIWKTLATLKDKLDNLMAGPRKGRANRRVRKHDRRRSVADGLIVTLSTREEKRRLPDRRHVPSDSPGSHR